MIYDGYPNNKSSGVKGVYRDHYTGLWMSIIRVGNRLKFLGRFTTIESAKRAWLEAKQKK